MYLSRTVLCLLLLALLLRTQGQHQLSMIVLSVDPPRIVVPNERLQVWVDPDSQASIKEVAGALKAAIEIHDGLRQFNQWRTQQQLTPIRIGIGLHTGPLLMGVIGDERRMDAAVVSDTVNTAARMEGLTKHFRASILLSEKSMVQIPPDSQAQSRYIGKVQVKGRTGALGIYECFAGDSIDIQARKSRSLATFAQAMNAYEAGEFAAAVALFQQILAIDSEDQAAHYYWQRSQDLQRLGVPPDWDGVAHMDRK